MLELRDLVVRYGRVAAVRGVTLTVKEGELVALLGANGAGKSTTLLTIAGALRPVSGEVSFRGESIAGLRPEQVVRLGVALVPEGRGLFHRLTVEENLRLGLTGGGKSRKRRDAFDSVFGSFPFLRDHLRAPAGTLSGGQQQQLAIARTLLAEPKLLLLDEPSLGLAPVVIDRVFEALTMLRSAGMTILLVEQKTARTASLADRVYLMQSGRIVSSGRADEVTKSPVFQQAYLGIGGKA